METGSILSAEEAARLGTEAAANAAADADVAAAAASLKMKLLAEKNQEICPFPLQAALYKWSIPPSLLWSVAN